MVTRIIFERGFIMIKFVLLLAALSSLNLWAMDVQIYNSKLAQFEQWDQVLNAVPEEATIVMGEEHYNELVQMAEGLVVSNIVEAKNAKGAFTAAWEFLDYPVQAEIATAMQNWKASNDDEAFLMEVFKNQNRAQSHQVYLPFLKTVKDLGGELLATNAPRDWKSIITATGLSSLDPSLVPPNMELGSDGYFERFKLVMQDHVPADKLQNYFEAQCYTDSVMSYQIMSQSSFSLRFMVVGSFHSDYFDGLVENYKKQTNLPVMTFKLVDASELSAQEIAELIKPDAQYGALADYILLLTK